MKRSVAANFLQRLHDGQNDLHAGGDGVALRGMLSNDVVWKVPGHNAIADTYRRVEAVLGYFKRRRTIAEAMIRVHRHDVLVGDGERGCSHR